MRLILRQTDGLGNQLFQYAAALYFCQKYGASLEILREPEAVAHSLGNARPFLLSHFRISCPVRERNAWDRLVSATSGGKQYLGELARIVSRTAVYRQELKDAWLFLPELKVRPFTSSFYLQGYLQAYQYAASVEARLRSDLQFVNEPKGQNSDVMRQIQNCAMPVSLHVRRGDYTKLSGGSLALPVGYYPRAIAAIRARVPNPVFFLFSDDIPFTRDLFRNEGNMVFVDHNDQASGFEDLRLMAACRHHIIANSTFSWWGAWLNPRSDKIVSAPDRWLGPELPATDLLTPEWIRIAVSPDSH